MQGLKTRVPIITQISFYLLTLQRTDLDAFLIWYQISEHPPTSTAFREDWTRTLRIITFAAETNAVCS